ncbi:MAG: sigma-54 dependent transcriptional regulator [Planctomycetota bacterium]|jgi:DNA-binding NtrC family response regulator|nr:sigma-54 dependent transcriptional regulator [Planctomycetota bacterium]
MDILLVEDERTLAIPLRDALADAGHRVTVRAEGAAAIVWLDSHCCDLVVTDVRLPRASGVEVLAAARRQDPPADVVVMTGYATVEKAVQAMKAGACAYLQKPFPVEALLVQVAQTAQLRGLQKQLESLPQSGASLFAGSSQGITQAQEMIFAAARVDSPVLLLGESGTGKERAARAIHARSSRASEPFLVLSCGGIPETLFEGEVFGYQKGAFTGADEDHAGLFEMVGRGTLFLDGLGDLPSSSQATLLRVLQEGTFFPLGGASIQQFSGRVLASLHPRSRSGECGVREDLLFRLCVLEISLPPLRDRVEDIPDLLSEMFQRYDPESRYRPSRKSLLHLSGRDWPGNVRELENSVQRALALSGRARVLQPEHFFPGDHTLEADILPLAVVCRQAEEGAIRKALAATGGKKIRAAELLGISRKALWKRLQDLGLGRGESS